MTPNDQAIVVTGCDYHITEDCCAWTCSKGPRCGHGHHHTQAQAVAEALRHEAAHRRRDEHVTTTEAHQPPSKCPHCTGPPHPRPGPDFY